jgi:hypothetical protein
VQAVTAAPEIMPQARHADDEFVILACDGIWDVMSSQECINFVAGLLRAQERPPSEVRQPAGNGADGDSGAIRQREAWDMGAVAEALLDKCLDKGSRDNMSVVIVSLKAAFAPGTAARRRLPAAAASATTPPAVRELVVKTDTAAKPGTPPPAQPAPQPPSPAAQPPSPAAGAVAAAVPKAPGASS